MSLTNEQKENYKQSFNQFDQDGNGTIDAKELKDVFHKMGNPVTDEVVQNMIESADLDKSGTVDFDEFCKMMVKYEEQGREQALKQAFTMFDTDNSGFLEEGEIKNAMEKLGNTVTIEQVKEMIKQVDTDSDGKVSFEEFKKMIYSYVYDKNKTKTKSCNLCKKYHNIEIDEDIDHFLWNCPFYEKNRKIWIKELIQINKNNKNNIKDIIQNKDSLFILSLVNDKENYDSLLKFLNKNLEIRADTAGQERYNSLTSMYYRGAKGAIIIYDVTNYDSYESAKDWIKEIRQQGSSSVKVMLVANKIDLIDHTVQKTEVLRYCEKHNLLFSEVSAKSGLGIDELFNDLSTEMINQYKTDVLGENLVNYTEENKKETNNFMLEEGSTNPKKDSGCC
ncbi:caltractin-like [Anaeramoeba flamelloides]|uniref:Caltractin-like n=1 Tax=Anaeramoeba flamelloides TaxID=1746091 RepID=A0ABQ8XCQ3_9EUKA|nr:caltractin-like [Anaeramoeba flamelloides]